MIVLLARGRDAVVDPELGALGDVQVLRTPVPPRGRATAKPAAALWADRQLAAVAEMVTAGAVSAFVTADEPAGPFAWRVAERFPAIPVLAGQPLATRILALLAERGSVVTTDAVRELLDAQRLPWPEVPGYFTNRSQRPQMVVSLVNNTVDVDSRVQKVARSLADLGYDSVLLGRSPRSEPDGDYLLVGSALVLRPNVVPGRLLAQLADPPGGRADLVVGAPDPSGAPGTGRLTRRLHEYRRRRQERNRESFSSGAPDHKAHQDRARRVTAGEIPAHQAYPAVLDWADVFVPLLADLRPDVIHVHDPALIPAATSARDLLERAGHRAQLVYDAHEWTLGVARDHALQVPALARLETEHMSEMAAVLTVSEPIAERMQRHFGLAESPAVVTNAPADLAVAESAGDIRSDLELAADVPLLVYTGTVAETRGLDLAFTSLKHVPRARLALLSRNTKATRMALRRARELGVGNRVHRLDYVAADEVPAYLRTADVGLIPFLPHVNSDLGIPTKFREYLLAGLPIVATDVGLTGAEVRRTGVGEVAPPDAPQQFAAAIRSVLADPAAYRSRISGDLRRANSWQEQERVLAQVYERVIGPPARFVAPAAGQVVIGGLNSAGQATAWAGALSARGVPARSLELRTPENPFRYRADEIIPRRSAETLQRRVQLLLRELLPAEALILESGRAVAAPEPGPVSGRRHGFREARALTAAGRNVGLIFHGSDLRRPELHARTHPWSPFHDPAFRAVTDELRIRTRRTHEQLASWEGPVMVSTPDLVRQNPAAVWVPVVVDADLFAAPYREPPSGPPVVLHLPSKSMMKGSRFIDPVLQELAAEGVIRYRRATDVPHERVPHLLRESDIFVDQLGMGIFGVAALEAMAAGIPVVTDPGDEALVAYGTDVPLVAVTPDSIAEGIRALAADAAQWQQLASAGPAFVRRFHDGTPSADAIIATMALRPGDTV